jgi:hypothetical protein
LVPFRRSFFALGQVKYAFDPLNHTKERKISWMFAKRKYNLVSFLFSSHSSKCQNKEEGKKKPSIDPNRSTSILFFFFYEHRQTVMKEVPKGNHDE